MILGAQMAKVADHFLGQNKNGKSFVYVQFELADGDKIAKELWLTTDNAKKHAASNLRTLGYEGNQLDDLNGTDLLVGNEVNITVQMTMDDYAGCEVPEVRWINDPANKKAPREALGPDEARAVSAKFSGIFGGADGGEDCPF